MHLKKYITLFWLSWQRQLEMRSEFMFERARSLAIMLSVYYLWSALLENQTSVLGYSRQDLLTYVLLMTLLRAWVLGCVTDRIPMEIAKGRLSELLLRPISHVGYWISQDLASKSLNIGFAVVEVSVFAWLVKAPLTMPTEVATWLWFGLATMFGMIMYFQLSYMLGVMGFWTAQSWGPRFCFEILLEFCAGAYFPIDVLPPAAQRALMALPFPYLIFAPSSIYLGRIHGGAIASCLLHQGVWIVVLSFGVSQIWKRGLRFYSAEGG